MEPTYPTIGLSVMAEYHQPDVDSRQRDRDRFGKERQRIAAIQGKPYCHLLILRASGSFHRHGITQQSGRRLMQNLVSLRMFVFSFIIVVDTI